MGRVWCMLGSPCSSVSFSLVEAASGGGVESVFDDDDGVAVGFSGGRFREAESGLAYAGGGSVLVRDANGKGASVSFSILWGVVCWAFALFFRFLYSWQALPSFVPIWIRCVPVCKQLRHILAGVIFSSGYSLF